MFAVAELNSIDELQEYGPLWREMLSRTRNANFFQSLEWFSQSCESTPGVTPRVLIVSVGARPVGIVPLVVREKPGLLRPMRVLTYPMVGGSCRGALGANPAVTLLGAIRHIRDSRRDWDVFELPGIDLHVSDRGRTANAFRSAAMHAVYRDGRKLSTIDIERSWQSQTARLRSRTAAAYERAETALGRAGELRVVRMRPEGQQFGDADPCWDVFNQIAGLSRHAKPTRSRSRRSPLDWSSLRSVHAAAVDAGAADMGLLLLDGRPIAGCYGYVRSGRLEIARMGADPAVGEPAMTALMGRMVRDGIDRGDSTYALTGAPETIRSAWETAFRPTTRYACFRFWSLPGRLHSLACRAGLSLGFYRNTAPREPISPVSSNTEQPKPHAQPSATTTVALRVVQ